MITPRQGGEQNPAYDNLSKSSFYILLMKKLETFFGLIKIPLDFTAVALAFLASYELRILTAPIPFIAKPIDIQSLPTVEEYFDFSLYATLALILVFALGKMYSLKSSTTLAHEIKKIFGLGLIWIMLIITYFFFTRSFPFSRLAMVYSWITTILFLIVIRTLIKIVKRILLAKGIGRKRVLIVGDNNVLKEIVETLQAKKSYKIVGILDAFPPHDTALKFDEIIQTTSKDSKEILEYCEEHHVEYTFVPDMLEVQRTNVEIRTLGRVPLITLKKTPLEGWGKIAKRLIDMFSAGIGLILLSPFFLIIAIAIKLDSGGPVFYSAKRIGALGKPFTCHKFRSMIPNSHDLRYSEEFAKNNIRAGSPLVKIVNDPRITRIGKLIRKFSIDELPQLWNILTGKMSLVGPRPHLPEEVAKYSHHHKFVLTIKPGLTGIPQISGRSDLDFETEVKLDRYYIEHWSIWMDIKTIFRTIWIVIRGYKE